MTVGRTSARRTRSPDPRRRPRRPNLRRTSPACATATPRSSAKNFPRIPRRVSGYNLDELLDENGFHVARALVGSEGTCATVVSATLNLTASPPFRVLTALGFADAFLAADAVPRVLEFGPIGLEGFDGLLLDFMRRKNLAVEDVALLPDGGGFLLVETEPVSIRGCPAPWFSRLAPAARQRCAAALSRHPLATRKPADRGRP